MHRIILPRDTELMPIIQFLVSHHLIWSTNEFSTNRSSVSFRDVRHIVCMKNARITILSPSTLHIYMYMYPTSTVNNFLLLNYRRICSTSSAKFHAISKYSQLEAPLINYLNFNDFMLLNMMMQHFFNPSEAVHTSYIVLEAQRMRQL